MSTWYKKSFHNDTEGTDKAYRMHKTFLDYYRKELYENPESAKGLAIFGFYVQYFHSNEPHHAIEFFLKHRCDPIPSQPIPLPDFGGGDEEFSKTLSENKERT